MPRTITKQVYQFDELSDRAKETARQWFRDASAHDVWWDSVYEDAESIGKMLGITMKPKDSRSTSTSAPEPSIWFTGFASQGDGACFEGRYAYAEGAPRQLRAFAPQDKELHALADDLEQLQKANFYRLTAEVTLGRGNYYHEYMPSIDVNFGDHAVKSQDAEQVTILLRRFMKWIYRQLEQEDEYRNADEQVDANILANEYEFEADGTRSRDA